MRKNKIICVLFSACLAVFFLTGLILPKRDFSENENRYLQGMPDFSWESVLKGQFMSEFESFVNDQLFLRDSLVSAKATMEKWSGKKENDGVYFAKNDSFIEKPKEIDYGILDGSVKSLRKLAQTGRYDISFAVIPTAYEILKETLPDYAYTPVQKEVASYLETNLEGSGIQVIRPDGLLEKHSGEYIYYRTDHHQTSYSRYPPLQKERI